MLLFTPNKRASTLAQQQSSVNSANFPARNCCWIQSFFSQIVAVKMDGSFYKKIVFLIVFL